MASCRLAGRQFQRRWRNAEPRQRERSCAHVRRPSRAGGLAGGRWVRHGRERAGVAGEVSYVAGGGGGEVAPIGRPRLGGREDSKLSASW